MINIKFSIKTKFFIIILIPAVILITVIYLDFTHLSSLGRSAEHILSKNYKSIQVAQQIRQLIDGNRNRLLTSLFQKTPDVLRGSGYEHNISSLLKACKENITEQGESQIIDQLISKHEKYNLLYSALSTNTDQTIKVDQKFHEFLSLTAAMIADLNELVLLNEKAMEFAEQQTRQVARKGMQYSVGLLCAAILFAVIFSYILSSRVSRPLTQLAQSLALIKEGKGKYPRVPVTSHDEIGFLTSEFNRLFERLEVYDQLSADKLTAEKLKVRQAEEAKAQFIADLSHQLKTPMTSLSMSVDMLHEKKDRLSEEKTRKLLQMTREDCFRLSTLINELVDISKLDASLKPRPKEILKVENVVTECLKPLTNQAKERKIHLKIDIQDELPPVAIDSLRFPWVITNLIGNAIRYTDQGGTVSLRVYMRGGRFYFKCKDAGTGIEAKFLPKIFDRFSQFSEREKSGAIGLGLAIVKEIIEQHGGDISVESKVGRGTTFTFWIPADGEEFHEKSTAD